MLVVLVDKLTENNSIAKPEIDRYTSLLKEFKGNGKKLKQAISNSQLNQERAREDISQENQKIFGYIVNYIFVFNNTIKILQDKLKSAVNKNSLNEGLEGQSRYHEKLYELENQNPFPPYLITCAARAIEQKIPNRLFDDNLAPTLAGSEVIQFVEEVELIDRTRPYVAVRTKFFDNFLKDAFQGQSSGLKQLVILGAGMDTRAFRLEFLKKITIWELDKPEVIKTKVDILKSIGRIPRNHHFIEVDLTQSSWTSLLGDRDYNPKLPSVWILEGILMYLSEAQVRDLFHNLQRLTAPGSCLGADFINEKAVLGREELWLSGFDNPEELLRDYGWNATVIQPGEEGACFDRYIRKLPPREVADVERAFFVTAHKS